MNKQLAKATTYSLLMALSSATATASTAETTALESFKLIVENCEKQINSSKNLPIRKTENGSFVKSTLSNILIRYDVRKTDSIVTPFSGVVVVNYQVAGAIKETEEEANSAAPAPDSSISENFLFSYQENKWKFATRTIEIRALTGPLEGKADRITAPPSRRPDGSPTWSHQCAFERL